MFKVSYHNALYAVAWGAHRRKEISDDDFATIKLAIADQPADATGDENDTCLCPQLEQLSYNVGVDNGIIDAAKQPLATINWSGLLQFLQALLPIILQFIAIINPKPTPPKPANLEQLKQQMNLLKKAA